MATYINIGDLQQSVAYVVQFFPQAFATGATVTGKVNGDWTKSIGKNSSDFAAMTVTVSEDFVVPGWYYCPLSTAHTDSAGSLGISLTATGVDPIIIQGHVWANSMDNLLRPVTVGRQLAVDGSGRVSVYALAANTIFESQFVAGEKLPATWAADIADVILDRNMATGVDSGTNSTSVRTVRQALRMLRNKKTISAGTLTVTKEDDSTTAFTAAVTTAEGNPISVVDPT